MPILRAFLPPLICTIEIILRFGRFIPLLLKQDPIQLDITIVHYQVLGHESFQLVTIDYIKGTVVLEASHEILDTVFVCFPVFLVFLDLNLRIR